MSTTAQASRILSGGLLSSPAMTTKDAFDGLCLQPNFELADTLEAWIKGAINTTATYGVAFDSNKCAAGAVKEYRAHGSWANHGHPWRSLQEAWILAAMEKIVHHVLDGKCIADLAEQDINPFVRRGEKTELARPAKDEQVARAEGDGEIEADHHEQQQQKDGGLFGSGSLLEMASRPRPARTPAHNADSPPAPRTISPSTRAASVRGLSIARSGKSNATPLPILSRRFRSDNKVKKSTPGSSNSSSRPVTRSVTKRGSIALASATPQTVPTRKNKNKLQAVAANKNDATITTCSSSARRGRSVKQDARTGEEYEAWSFDRILDSRWAGTDRNKTEVDYKIKWTYGKWTWQPSIDLFENPDDITEFHEKYPEKPGPPAWFLRVSSEEA